MLGMSLAPIATMVCSVCDMPRNTNERMTLFLTDPNLTPVEKLGSLVASGCCPLCGNKVSCSQTPDAYIARYIEFIQGADPNGP